MLFILVSYSALLYLVPFFCAGRSVHTFLSLIRNVVFLYPLPAVFVLLNGAHIHGLTLSTVYPLNDPAALGRLIDHDSKALLVTVSFGLLVGGNDLLPLVLWSWRILFLLCYKYDVRECALTYQEKTTSSGICLTGRLKVFQAVHLRPMMCETCDDSCESLGRVDSEQRSKVIDGVPPGL